MADLNDRLTRVFKGPGYNPYRAQCGQFTEEGNAGGECDSGGSGGSGDRGIPTGDIRENKDAVSAVLDKDSKALEDSIKGMSRKDVYAKLQAGESIVDKKTLDKAYATAKTVESELEKEYARQSSPSAPGANRIVEDLGRKAMSYRENLGVLKDPDPDYPDDVLTAAREASTLSYQLSEGIRKLKRR